jgi:hypothetical protein
MKTKSILMACAMALGIVTGVNAQELQAQQTNSATVAKVDITNTKVVNQEGNKLTIGFDLKSEDVYQPQIAYSLKVSKTEEKTITLMDQKTYPDKIDLESGKTVHREITYEAPSFLAGKNDIEIEIKSFAGFLLAIGRIDGVNFSGDGQYVSINGSSCKTVDGKSIIEQGTLAIERGKSFEVACEVKNKAKDALNIVTSVDIYQNKVFSFGNNVLQNSVGNQVQINGGEKKTLSFVVPKIDMAQSYSALFSLQDEKKNRISDISGVMFLVKGDAFLVDNVMFDKQAYVAGDTAEVSIVWDHNLDRIDGREQAPFEAYLTDENGSSCSNETVKSIHKKGELSSKLALPVSSVCKNPKIILNGTDVIYSQKVEKRASVVNSGKSTYLENNKKLLGTLLVIILVGCLLLIGFAASKRKSGSGLRMFLLCCFVLGMSVVFSNKASATTTFTTGEGISVWSNVGHDWIPSIPNNGSSSSAYSNGVCYGNHFPPYVATSDGPYSAFTPNKRIYYDMDIYIDNFSVVKAGETRHLNVTASVNDTAVTIYDKDLGYADGAVYGTVFRIIIGKDSVPNFNVAPSVPGKYPLVITTTFAGVSGSSSGYIVVIDPKEPKCGTAAGQAYANAPKSNLCVDSLNLNAPDSKLVSGKWWWDCESTCWFNADQYPFWANEGCTALSGCGSANGGSYSTAPSGAALCNAGTASAVTDAVTSWTWSCSGLTDGTANCSAVKASLCGSANNIGTSVKPSVNICVSGATPSEIIESSSLWTWTCKSSDGTLTSNCIAPKIADCTPAYMCEYNPLINDDICNGQSGNVNVEATCKCRIGCEKDCVANPSSSDCNSKGVRCSPKVINCKNTDPGAIPGGYREVVP